ncbi:MAG: hypothetical protein ACD_40C00053G0010 [uncultured bacterium]|nr:MAG: hypothetical protein ACD_40C00053G0010 [uncultured bacterium]
MVRLPIFKPTELVKIAKKKGFVAIRQSGSHRIFKHPDGRWTTIPIHTKTVGRGLASKIIKDIGGAL